MAALHDQKIMVELSTGTSIPFRAAKSPKTGNVYHAVLKRKADGTYYNPGKYGVKVAPEVVGGKLPTSAGLNGVTANAVSGTTTTGNRKVSFSADVTVDGQPRKLRLSISALPNGDFNVSGVLNRPGGSSATQAHTSL